MPYPPPRTFSVILSLFCGLLLLSSCHSTPQQEIHLPDRTPIPLTLTEEQQGPASINGQYSARLAYFEQFRQENVDVCFLGDSITERLDWQDAYPSLRVSNRGIGSDTTLGVLARLGDVEAQSPRAVALMAGINDISIGRSTDEIIETYAELLDELSHRLPDTALVVTCVLPVTAAHSIDNADVQALNVRLQPLCKEKGVAYVDVYSEFCDADGNLNTDLAADNVHPNISGYLVWLQALDTALSGALM